MSTTAPTPDRHSTAEAEAEVYAAYRRGDIDADTTLERLSALQPPTPHRTEAEEEELSRWAESVSINPDSPTAFRGEQAAALGRAMLRRAGHPVDD